MSLLEIKKLIKEKNLTPRLNSDSMMKEGAHLGRPVDRLRRRGDT